LQNEYTRPPFCYGDFTPLECFTSKTRQSLYTFASFSTHAIRGQVLTHACLCENKKIWQYYGTKGWVQSDGRTDGQTDRGVLANKPDTIIENKNYKTCLLTDVAIPPDTNVLKRGLKSDSDVKWECKNSTNVEHETLLQLKFASNDTVLEVHNVLRTNYMYVHVSRTECGTKSQHMYRR
jgi:hypothetical protein